MKEYREDYKDIHIAFIDQEKKHIIGSLEMLCGGFWKRKAFQNPLHGFYLPRKAFL